MSRSILSIFALALLCGCSATYIVQQGMGQLSIAVNRTSIQEVLNDPNVLESDKEQIRLALAAKAFGEDQLGLTRTDNYTSIYNTSGHPVSYVVSASRRDRFDAYAWHFPIVGTLPYKGFFDLHEAHMEQRLLEQSGYDAAVHPVAAYSTLGWFSDPIYSPMLDYPPPLLVNVILHELVHGTVYAPDQSEFNESIASFIAEEGMLKFFESRYGRDSMDYREAEDLLADERLYAGWIQLIRDRLNVVYDSALPEERKIAVREWIFHTSEVEFGFIRGLMRTRGFRSAGTPMNNADVLASLRYHRNDAYEPAFMSVNGDLKRFIKEARSAATQPDPIKAMLFD